MNILKNGLLINKFQVKPKFHKKSEKQCHFNFLNSTTAIAR